MLKQQRLGVALLSSDKMLVEVVPGLLGMRSRHLLWPRVGGGSGASGGEAKAAALHADLQAVC